MLSIGTEVEGQVYRSNDPWPISDSQSLPIRNIALWC